MVYPTNVLKILKKKKERIETMNISKGMTMKEGNLAPSSHSFTYTMNEILQTEVDRKQKQKHVHVPTLSLGKLN